jgi:hypothetical protein
MADFGPGNLGIHSTTLGESVNPTTSALLAEIDSTALYARAGGTPYQVTWIVGGNSTGLVWALEQCLSTGLAMSTAGRAQTVAYSAIGQSAQFVTRHTVEVGDRLRARLLSTFTGSAAAKIIAEPLV